VPSHEDKVRDYLRSFLKQHHKFPTQQQVRKAGLGNTARVTEAWQSVRSEPEFSLESPSKSEFKTHGDTASLTVKLEKTKGIFSEKMMLERFGVDTNIWRVKEMQIKTWRGLIGDGKTVLQDWAFLKLERIISEGEHEKLEGLKNAYLSLAKKHSPKYPRLPKQKRGEFLLEPVFADVHFGKQAWGEETGASYDLKIAAEGYKSAGEDLFNKLKHYPANRILMPIGNDLLHVDNPMDTTTRGTPQQTDGRWQKAYRVALENVVWSIDLFSQLAPVDVVIVPGNHAAVMETLLGEHIKTWYRSNPSVTVDTTPKPRKYYQWKNVLLGLTHGDNEKKARLPNLMSFEAKPDLSKIVCREFHTGHLHTRVVEEFEGVTIRTLPALSGDDSWHNAKGFKGNLKACEGFVFSEKGFEASHVGRP
jgi:hypothetical protein